MCIQERLMYIFLFVRIESCGLKEIFFFFRRFDNLFISCYRTYE